MKKMLQLGPARFRVKVRNVAEGGVHWLTQWYDGGLANMMGEESAWSRVSDGRASTREKALDRAHQAAVDWLWRRENPEETIEEFELSTAPVEIEVPDR
jgi:hypothetical protein